ncbi:MAG: signal recognition particle receptor subunit alpha [Nanoarchaeota archaeon]|nr:signal recognition particle receptor subunit alpha [Nanoarchaeota archaeon]MBU2520149.1 signal recognition particle receptor subunit alpha [Nanoarchaeota archaeon]
MVLKKFGDTLKGTFRKIAGMSLVDKEAVEMIVHELQRGLIQADVDIAMVAELSKNIKKKVLEDKLPPGLSLKELFIKTLYDEIVAFLGEEKAEIKIGKQKILVAGLFASGKTTSIAKIAKWFKVRGLNPGLVACDTHRAAAQEQLKQLAQKVGAAFYAEGKKPEDIARNALKNAKEDVLIFDSAGRDALDKELARELKELGKIIKPDEVLLVIPADIGQAAKKQAEEFNKLVGITGVVVTKLDGTAKGGGSLAATAVSGAKVKFIGTGEKIGDLELYDPKRFVARLIGYGDIQGLLEKAKEAGLDESDVKKIMEGQFTMIEFQEQIKSMRKMGPLSKVAEMVPGLSGMKIPDGMLDIQEEKMTKWQYMIDSMTKDERENPETIKQNRIIRIAHGSGTSDIEVRELLKYYKQIKKIMKLTKGGKGFKRGPFARIAKQMGLKT